MFLCKKILFIILLLSAIYADNTCIFALPKIIKNKQALPLTYNTDNQLHTTGGKYSQFFNISDNYTEFSTSNNLPDNHIKALVILVEFEDLKFSVNDPKVSFHNMLNSKGYSYNGATGSATDYLNSNFNGYHTFSFDIIGPVALPSKIERYGAATPSSNDIDAKQMVVDACAIAAEYVDDFSEYDCNKDGIIDNVHIIYAGNNQAAGAPSNAIWSHQWNIEDKNITYNNVKLSSYSCSSELRGAKDSIINTIGSFCHEYLHSWGLIDMYDTNKETEGLSKALYGNLSIMDNGYELNEGNTPPYLNAIEREIIGTATIIDLVPGNKYTLLPINENGTIGRIKTNTEGEYFLLECRNMSKWDKFIAGEGLVVYHVDKSENIYAGISSIKRWEFNNVNTYAQHPCARVIAAGGENTNSISDIFFPGVQNTTTLNSQNGNTRLLDWNGRPVGIALENISYKNNRISFTTTEDLLFSNKAPIAKEIQVIQYQESARLLWKCDSTSTNLRWKIQVEDSKNNTIQEFISDSTYTLIRNLEPGSEYSVKISSIIENICGAEVVCSLTTKDIKSIYPIIFVKDQYAQNEIIDLRVFDISEPYNRIIWHVNGQRLTEDTYKIPANSSKLRIIAQIIYNDGTDEYIYKTVFIQ